MNQLLACVYIVYMIYTHSTIYEIRFDNAGQYLDDYCTLKEKCHHNSFIFHFNNSQSQGLNMGTLIAQSPYLPVS